MCSSPNIIMLNNERKASPCPVMRCGRRSRIGRPFHAGAEPVPATRCGQRSTLNRCPPLSQRGHDVHRKRGEPRWLPPTSASTRTRLPCCWSTTRPACCPWYATSTRTASRTTCWPWATWPSTSSCRPSSPPASRTAPTARWCPNSRSSSPRRPISPAPARSTPGTTRTSLRR
ncbi:hypothetical protein D3C81_1613180 [compost metagenome]